MTILFLIFTDNELKDFVMGLSKKLKMIHGELFQELQKHRLKKWYLKGQSIF